MMKKKTFKSPTKAPSQNGALIAEIKKEMVDYIGPIFEDLSMEIRGMKTEMESFRVENRGTRILLEQMQKRFDLALDVSGAVNHEGISLKDHEVRISDLETDVGSVKSVLGVAKA